MGFFSKYKYRIKLKHYFSTIEDFLCDGYYTVSNKDIKKIDSSEASFYQRFKVNSKKEKVANYSGGSFFFTQYKAGFLTEDKAFYFINEKEKYESYKNNYKLYKDKLPYPAISLDFYDNRLLVVAPIIKGSIIKDASHFDAFIDLLFEYASKSNYEMRDTTDSNLMVKLPWYVQHGDCKNANIIWKDNSNHYTMIDLEAIDIYPPLYDVFYFLFITKKEESIKILKSNEFEKRVVEFYSKVIKPVPSNIVDITLSNYAYYTVSRVKKGVELYEYEFYLFWRKYDSFDKYPITQKVLKDYDRKIKEYRIK